MSGRSPRKQPEVDEDTVSELLNRSLDTSASFICLCAACRSKLKDPMEDLTQVEYGNLAVPAAKEVRVSRGYSRNVRNKSPSDLEADLEDNQDYDSAACSQSETNLTIIGQTTPAQPPLSRVEGHISPEHVVKRTTLSNQRDDYTRPVSYPSRFHENDPELENIQYNSHPGMRMGLSRLRGKEYSDSQSSRTNNYRGSSPESSEVVRLTARNRELERLLDVERHGNRKLKEDNSTLERLLEARDQRITQLEREIQLLQNDIDAVDEDNEKLYQENRALLRAMRSLNTS